MTLAPNRYMAVYKRVGSDKSYHMTDSSIKTLRQRLAQVDTVSFTIWSKAQPKRAIIGIKYASEVESIFA